jgi:hypothetical protein
MITVIRPSTLILKQWRKPLKVVADVGKTRVIGTVLKSNPLTTLVKIEPESLINLIRSYFMENGISLTEYHSHLKEMGVKRNGITKRHNLKHRVTYAGQ